jgi:hypothetical protein
VKANHEPTFARLVVSPTGTWPGGLSGRDRASNDCAAAYCGVKVMSSNEID